MKHRISAQIAALALASAGLVHADTAGPSLQQGPTLFVGDPRGASDPVIFDSFTGAPTLTTTTGMPRTFIGGAGILAASGPEIDVTGGVVFVSSTATQSFSNGLRIQIQFWDAYDAANATTVFSTPAGAVQEILVPGPVSLTANSFTQVDFTLAAPIRLVGTGTKGFAINIQGDNGGGFASTDTLTTLLATEPEPGNFPTLSVGQNGVSFPPDGGFYRNVAGQTTFNFGSGDRRTFASVDNIRPVLVLRGIDGVPVTLQSFDVE